MSGPLNGVRIIEFEAIGPSPYACMMLADNGADVIRIGRVGGSPGDDILDVSKDILSRSRRVVRLDLKTPQGVERARELVRTADAIVEGLRPGVMEKLGLGPDVLLADQPKLIYARMTGWGQSGPYAAEAGHDINYIALAGTLHALGREGEKPTPPINLVGDFGGGGMLLAFGIVSAILNARVTGMGQVIDCSMLDGSASLMSMIWSLRAAGQWRDVRGVNLLDTGSHFYDTYETSDGKYVAIGSVEPQFYRKLLDGIGITDLAFDSQMRSASWPELKVRLTEIFKTRTRAEWCEALEYRNACFAPVLSMAEAPHHPHNIERGVFVEVDGVVQPGPAPRYSRTPNATPRMMTRNQDDTDDVFGGL
ncbi:MAG: CaiB/BaiF CoA-transferase family protein [Novosphingobium sp.]